MTMPRSKYVADGEEGVYHCFSRCVRGAFLYGFDVLTGRDHSHRKQWMVDRLRYLASIFAIDVCAYAVMENHSHNILRTRPDISTAWSDEEVAARWLTLCPPKPPGKNKPVTPLALQIQALAACPERIAVLRKRLCSISWFMAKLNEYIARAANKEDRVKGRFWEGRFKCRALLDEAAIAAGMTYVDLNLIRAGIAATPEESNFTSIQERLRTWQKQNTVSNPDTPSLSTTTDSNKPEHVTDSSRLSPNNPSAAGIPSDRPDPADSWLCPIQSDAHRRGILSLSATDYFHLVDQSGRLIRSDKRGAIDAHLAPILVRIGAIPDAWCHTVSHFGSKFRLAAGQLDSLRKFANRLGNHWLAGVTSARLAFASPPEK